MFSFAVVLASHAANVRLGIDCLQDESFETLKGKKVGLVAHPASVNSKLVSTVDVLRGAEQCQLTVLFGPEHGVYGDEYAGVKIADRKDASTGLPVYSLYGDTRKPTPEMLKGLDALVFDLQDIGSRSYTYISTMKLCLEACAEAGIEFVVLDRPNPLGGQRIEGPRVEKDFHSFISGVDVPYLHAMTMGELALLVKEEVAPHYDKLRIVKMSGWNRSMVWSDTGLNWVPTSPHIPHASSCWAYAATGILGELGQISNGVGYTSPFELIGAPWIKAESLAEALQLEGKSSADFYKNSALKPKEGDLKSPRSFRGIQFYPLRFKPFYSLFKDQPCEGVQICANPKEAESLVEINFRVLSTLGAPKLFRQASSSQISMFDKACGTSEPRKWLLEERDLGVLFERWKAECGKFREARHKFLLYD